MLTIIHNGDIVSAQLPSGEIRTLTVCDGPDESDSTLFGLDGDGRMLSISVPRDELLWVSHAQA